MFEYILNILPDNIKSEVLKINIEELTELRLRVGKNVILRYGVKELEIQVLINKIDLLNILKKASTNSIYAIQNDINNGFLTIKGGHRIGITGETVIENGIVKNIKNISSMNIRIAKQIIGVSDKVINDIFREQIFTSTLIVSPPGCGKTTLLRDIIRRLSNEKYNIGVIDERGEIASMNEGKTYLDIGKRTDVISFCPKPKGINMIVRSMSEDIIATDEIGSKEDIEAIKYASHSGVKLLFTIHGDSLEDILKNKDIKELIDSGKFCNVIVLSNEDGKIGKVKEIYSDLGKIKYNELIYREVV